MDERKKNEETPLPTDERSNSQPTASPGTDPTNPHNQEPVGDWVANERAAERRNNEPGLTDEDRKQRKW